MATRGIWRKLFVPREPEEPIDGALFRSIFGLEQRHSLDEMFSHCRDMKSSA